MIVKGGVRVVANGKQRSGTALIDTGATTTIIDTSLADELKLRPFGERDVTTLGAPVKSAYADVDNMVVEDTEIGPRRLLVYGFPDDVRQRLRSLGCSDRLIVGVAEIESAGYVPNTATGKLQRVGMLAL